MPGEAKRACCNRNFKKPGKYDEILCMLEEQKHNGTIKSFIIKESVCHFFMY